MGHDLNDFLKSVLKRRHDEDFLDKFNGRYTSYLMFALGLSVFAQEYSGDPMKCWAKPSWADSWVDYTEDFCFIEGTFALSLNETIPSTQELLLKKRVTFYQWLPFIFYLMGILLQLPHYFWSFINWTSYLHLTGFCNVAAEAFRHKAVHGKKEKELDAYIRHFEDAITRKCKKSKTKKVFPRDHGVERAFRMWNDHVSPRYLYISYLCMKAWHVANTLLLLIMLNRLIADQWDNDIFGYSTFRSILSGINWRHSSIFPRVTLCSFFVREMGIEKDTQISRKTANCVLPVHLFVEKFFLFLWPLLVSLLIANVMNWMAWIMKFQDSVRDSFLKDLIRAGENFIDYTKCDNLQLEDEEKEEEKKLAKLEAGDKSDPQIEDDIRDTKERLKSIHESKKDFHKRQTEEAKTKHINDEKRFLYNNLNQSNVKEFRNRLGSDGLLTIYMIYSGSGHAIASQIISQFFYDELKKKIAEKKNEKEFEHGYPDLNKRFSLDF